MTIQKTSNFNNTTITSNPIKKSSTSPIDRGIGLIKTIASAFFQAIRSLVGNSSSGKLEKTVTTDDPSKLANLQNSPHLQTSMPLTNEEISFTLGASLAISNPRQETKAAQQQNQTTTIILPQTETVDEEKIAQLRIEKKIRKEIRNEKDIKPNEREMFVDYFCRIYNCSEDLVKRVFDEELIKNS